MELLMEWERYKEMFVWDGSLRDIYVPRTDLSDWQRLLDGLRDGPYELQYMLGEERTPLPERVETIFTQWQETSVALSIDEPTLGLICHFFWPAEIEFDLDPRAITGNADLDRLRAFMHMVGRLLGKEVLLTPENMPERPFLRYDPQTGGEDWPTYEG